MRDIFGFFTFVFFILIGLFAVWYGLRSYGQGRETSSYQTPLVKRLISQAQKNPIQFGPQQNKSESPLNFARINHENGQWLVNQKESLEEILPLAKGKTLLLFVQWKSPKALPELRSFLKKENLGENIIFCSRSDGILKDIRELEPEWTYCNGEVFMTRILSFDSLGLESLMKISADVFFIHLKNLKLDKGFESLVQEAKRQNKLVIIGPSPRPMDGLTPHAWLIAP